VAGSSEPVELLSLEHFKFVHDVNVLGPLRMMQAFLPMIRKAKGRVINISRSAVTGDYCYSRCGRIDLIDSVPAWLAFWLGDDQNLVR
jgi:NAD(P)-dependent dehydrogenase (short-subunit alcohol dehydrogenase family)